MLPKQPLALASLGAGITGLWHHPWQQGPSLSKRIQPEEYITRQVAKKVRSEQKPAGKTVYATAMEIVYRHRGQAQWGIPVIQHSYDSLGFVVRICPYPPKSLQVFRMCHKNKVKAEKRFACLMQPLGKLFGSGEGNLLCRASQPPHVDVGIKGCARMFPTVNNSSELVHDSDSDAPK